MLALAAGPLYPRFVGARRKRSVKTCKIKRIKTARIHACSSTQQSAGHGSLTTGRGRSVKASPQPTYRQFFVVIVPADRHPNKLFSREIFFAAKPARGEKECILLVERGRSPWGDDAGLWLVGSAACHVPERRLFDSKMRSSSSDKRNVYYQVFDFFFGQVDELVKS